VLPGPAIEIGEHPQAAASDCFYFGEIERNDVRGSLSLHNFAKFENGVAVNDSAFAFNHREIAKTFGLDR
jgi:hypothetical protein